MRNQKYELLLAAVIAARATSFIFSKMVLENMAVFNLLSIRFILAFLFLAVTFHKKLRLIRKSEFLSGLLIGLLFFLVMSCELTALETTASSTVSLLENCSIILVPLFQAVLLKKLPGRSTMLCALIAVLGVFCLTASLGSFTPGVLISLLAAVLYAIAILVTASVTHDAASPLCIGIVQVGTMGFLALAASFLLEMPTMPASGSEWAMIIVLAVVCTGFGFTLQPVAQSRVSAERAGLFCALSPAIAAVLGAVVLHEHFGLLSGAGLLLILFSILLPYLRKAKKPQTS